MQQKVETPSSIPLQHQSKKKWPSGSPRRGESTYKPPIGQGSFVLGFSLHNWLSLPWNAVLEYRVCHHRIGLPLSCPNPAEQRHTYSKKQIPTLPQALPLSTLWLCRVSSSNNIQTHRIADLVQIRTCAVIISSFSRR